MKKQIRVALALLVSALAVLAAAAPRAGASDESGDVTIKIQAPLDAADCSAAPPTITVLGLVIDTTNASFEVESEDDDGDDVSAAKPKSGSGLCTDLVPGAATEVKLPSDVVPLEASEVEQEGESEEGTELQAPLQAVDPAAGTITLLGLTIDASTATLEGDDDDDDGGGQPVDLSQLSVGQFVEAQLDASQLPALVATRIEVKNFENQVEVEVDDEHGDEVDDDSATVNVDATVTVHVKIPAKKGHKARVVRRTVHITKATSGRFVLSGLPKGVAVIKITRDVNGAQTAARRAVKVQPNTMRTLKMRLHKTKAK